MLILKTDDDFIVGLAENGDYIHQKHLAFSDMPDKIANKRLLPQIADDSVDYSGDFMLIQYKYALLAYEHTMPMFETEPGIYLMLSDTYGYQLIYRNDLLYILSKEVVSPEKVDELVIHRNLRPVFGMHIRKLADDMSTTLLQEVKECKPTAYLKRINTALRL